MNLYEGKFEDLADWFVQHVDQGGCLRMILLAPIYIVLGIWAWILDGKNSTRV